MAELQTLNAATDLAKLALSAAIFVHRVIRGAESEAEGLCKWTTRVNGDAKNIETMIHKRMKDCHDANEERTSIYVSIKESLTECKEALSVIYDELQNFNGDSQMSQIQKLQRNWSYVRSSKSLKQKIQTIKEQFVSMNTSIGILNSYDHLDNLQSNHTAVPLSSAAAPRGTQSGRSVQSAPVQSEVATVSHTISLHAQIAGNSRSLETSRHRQDNEVESRLIIAIKEQNAADVRQLINTGQDLRARDKNGQTFLHYAALYLDEGVVSVLLETVKPLDPTILNAQTADGKTALMIAAAKIGNPGSFELASFLVEQRCDLNLKDAPGRCALYIAIDGQTNGKDRLELARLLMNNGADFESLEKRFGRKYKQFKDEMYEKPEQPRRSGLLKGIKNVSRKFARRHSSAEPSRSQLTPIGDARSMSMENVNFVDPRRAHAEETVRRHSV